MYSQKTATLTSKSKELIERWNAKYSEEISIYFREQTEVLDAIRKNFAKLADSNKNNREDIKKNVYDFHNTNLSLLKTLYVNLKTKNEIKEFAINLKSALLKDIECIEEKVTAGYPSNKTVFETGVYDNIFLRKTGSFFYHLRSFPHKVWNLFARLIKKTDTPLKPRQHKIYPKHIVKSFLLNEYVAILQKRTYLIQKELVQYASEIFQLESRLMEAGYQLNENEPWPEKVPDLSNHLKEIDTFSYEYQKTLNTLFGKSGTWELPFFRIRYLTNRKLKNTFEIIESACKLWHITFYTFYENWRFREELFLFLSGVKIEASQILTSYSQKLDKTLTPLIEDKKEYLEQLIDRIPNVDDIDLSSLKHFFTSELYNLQKISREQNIKEELNKTQTEIEKLLQKVEVDINKALEEFPEKSATVRSPDYEKGISRTEIYFFSPSEFIKFECVPPLLDKLASISGDFTTNFQEVIEEFSDFDQITDFSLDTAVSMLNAQNSPEQTILMFREGLQRSLNILYRIEELSNKTIYPKKKELTNSYSDFFEQVQILDNNDKILNINSKLVKSKAIQKSKDNRRKLTHFIFSTARNISSYTKFAIKVTSIYHKELQKRLNLDKAPQTVSSEISNYLAEINKKIIGLPVIYRHLFENAPVKEPNLFLSRKPELDKLNEALKDWKAGNFAATLLIGENGSGKSSLLQYYLKTVKGSSGIKYLHINGFYHSVNDFFELMKEVFDNPNLTSDKDIKEQINTLQGLQIIALDGIERIFLRKPEGFACLQKLLSLIVSTNNRVFWIGSISLHACNYLDKTISLKENFDYHIELYKLSADQIKSIILKRHRLSGYTAHYKDNVKEPEKSKKIKEREDQLEKDFFNNLNKFAESNISLSFYYWLESISEFTANEVYIKRFQSPDFRFLETLSAEKIYTLLLIVLHGKINVRLHSDIFNHPTEKSYKVLTILKEDSVIVRKGDYYILNGILYRHVIQLLKNKNLIH